MGTHPNKRFCTLTNINFYRRIFPTPTMSTNARRRVSRTTRKRRIIKGGRILRVLGHKTDTRQLRAKPSIRTRCTKRKRRSGHGSVSRSNFFAKYTRRVRKGTSSVFGCNGGHKLNNGHRRSRRRGARGPSTSRLIRSIKRDSRRRAKSLSKVSTRYGTKQRGGRSYRGDGRYIRGTSVSYFPYRNIIFASMTTRGHRHASTRTRNGRHLSRYNRGHITSTIFYGSNGVKGRVGTRSLKDTKRYRATSARGRRSRRGATRRYLNGALRAFLRARATSGGTRRGRGGRPRYRMAKTNRRIVGGYYGTIEVRAFRFTNRHLRSVNYRPTTSHNMGRRRGVITYRANVTLRVPFYANELGRVRETHHKFLTNTTRHGFRSRSQGARRSGRGGMGGSGHNTTMLSHGVEGAPSVARSCHATNEGRSGSGPKKGAFSVIRLRLS